MSTRSTTHFGFGKPSETKPEAIVYRHSDGYPDAMLPDLGRFFAAVEEETSRTYPEAYPTGGGTRFSDPSYLAAKWVVWLARMFSTPRDRETFTPLEEHEAVGSLDFLGVGVVMYDPGDIEYRYWVDCKEAGNGGRPTVYMDEVDGNWRRVEITEAVSA